MTLDPAALQRVWATLPDPGIPGLEARWLGPSVDGELAGLIPRLSSVAYSHLAYTRWLDPIRGAPAMWRADGEIDPSWVAAIHHSADRLRASHATFAEDLDPRWWTSWLLWELPEPHRHLAHRHAAGTSGPTRASAGT